MIKPLLVCLSLAVTTFLQAGPGPKSFKVISAVERSSYPGVQGSPIEKRITITMVMRKKGSFQADSFWMDGLLGAARLSNHSAEKAAWRKKDTLVWECNVYKPTYDIALTPPNDRIEGSPAGTAPVSCEGKMVLRYRFRGKTYHYCCTSTTQGGDVYMP
ncbi:MAG: hypothetical protein JNL57_05295 [Bacteroidetes bacterium]|nr:hypothetical protein [Bacteroidota bacterium]